MIALLLPLAWALVVVGLAARWRPAPVRVRSLTGPDRRASTGTVATDAGCPGPGPLLAPAAGRVLERLGRRVLERSGRHPDPAAARRLGGALVAGAATLPLSPLLALPAALVAWALPAVHAGQVESRRRAALAADLPEIVDLLALAVGAGLTVHLALGQVTRRSGGPLAAELARVVDEVALGRRLAEALEELPARAGEAVRPLVAALVASERYGAPLAAGLDRLADEVRRDRRRRAEEAARKVPVKLLFPLVTCTLPAFGLLTVAPLIASAVRSLRI